MQNESTHKTDDTEENKKIIVNEIRSKWGKFTVKELNVLKGKGCSGVEGANSIRSKQGAGCRGSRRTPEGPPLLRPASRIEEETAGLAIS